MVIKHRVHARPGDLDHIQFSVMLMNDDTKHHLYDFAFKSGANVCLVIQPSCSPIV